MESSGSAKHASAYDKEQGIMVRHLEMLYDTSIENLIAITRVEIEWKDMSFKLGMPVNPAPTLLSHNVVWTSQNQTWPPRLLHLYPRGYSGEGMG